MPTGPDPVRAIVLVNSLAGGGAERVVTRLLGAMASRAGAGAYRLALLDPVVAYELPAGVPVHVLGRRIRNRVWRMLAQVVSVVRLVRLVRRERPAAILSFMTRSNIVALAGRRLARAWPPTVVSERVAVSENYRGLCGLLARAAIRRLYPRADRVVAVSRGVAEELEALGVARGRVVVIPNPVDPDELEIQSRTGPPHRWADGRVPLLVGVGRLEPQKGFHVLLEALRRLRTGREVRLVVFGEGQARGALESQARRLGLAGSVEWVGFHPNPFPTVARADVFVLPSLWEGFPNALLEAMALGRAVVASDCRWGPRELLADGECGLLVPPAEPGALAAAIERLLASEPLRREYGERARRRAAAFALPGIAGRYLEVLESCLEAAAPPAPATL
ncbi:MAG TPA: glycosyltransferase [Thermodesulfobacteriota bacterium]|nr:glycosyltransferase [Thermodesulfobacteriota bacterium]